MQIKIKKLGGGTFEVDVDAEGTVSISELGTLL